MDAFKTFVATGAPGAGTLYAGDLNTFQALVAALTNFAQNVSVAQLRVGDSGLQISKYGTGEFAMTGSLRVYNVLRALGGFIPAQMTTAQRDALTAGNRPFGLVIHNTSYNRLEMNFGTDAVPAWGAVGTGAGGNVDISPGVLTTKGIILNNAASFIRFTTLGDLVDGVLEVLQSGDTIARVNMNSRGKVGWGAGGASALDVWFGRSAAGRMEVTGQLVATDGIATRVVAGGLDDSDFAAGAVNGLIAVDGDSHALKWRSGGVWRSVTESELGYEQSVGTINVPGAGAGTDIFGINIDFGGGMTAKINVWLQYIISASSAEYDGASIEVRLMQDSVDQGSFVQTLSDVNGHPGFQYSVKMEKRVTLSGSHNFTINALTQGGNGQVVSTAGLPSFIQVTRV